MSASSIGIGVIGCGVISAAYLKALRHFPVVSVRALADQDAAAADARAAEFGVPAVPVDALLADPEIQIVLNLTPPAAHVPVGLRVLAAGKHLYGEKPLGVDLAEGRRLVDAAAAGGLRLGSAPDTFLGGGQQTARRAIDQGAIGRPLGGTAFMMVPGHERWHPNPDFYYAARGGGPLLDMGPYYLTALVQMLGPIAAVTAFGGRFRQPRRIQAGPRAGAEIPVDCLTHIAGSLAFAEGAIVQICTSFEVWRHRHGPIEIYGEAGSLVVPDPNRFDGTVELCPPEGEWRAVPSEHGYGDDNYRGLGLADMAEAIRAGRPHRACGALALHVLEVMAGLIRSAEGAGVVTIESRPERPAALAPGQVVGI